VSKLHPELEAGEAAVRALAAEWSRDLEKNARRAYEDIAAEITMLDDDAELADLTLASCISNMETIMTMLRSGIPAASARAPVSAIEHARAMGQRGEEVDATLHFYRVGVGGVLLDWNAAMAQRTTTRDELVAAIQRMTAFCLEYIDVVSSAVSAAHLAERERRQRRAAILRAEVIRELLSGRPFDLQAAERTLGHALNRAQLAFVCWTDRDPSELDKAASAVAGVVGRGRPLLIEDGPRAVTGWIVPRTTQLDWVRLDREVAAAAPGVSVAVGDPGEGVEGFRLSHDQACRARRVASLSRMAPTPVVRYADCALVDLLSQDLDAARAFVRSELGGLATADESTRTLRRTVREVVRPRGGVAVAARVLRVHRNTVVQRIQRAEALRGRNLDERSNELHAALLLHGALTDD
jgi:hypothetical protein